MRLVKWLATGAGAIVLIAALFSAATVGQQLRPADQPGADDFQPAPFDPGFDDRRPPRKGDPPPRGDFRPGDDQGFPSRKPPRGDRGGPGFRNNDGRPPFGPDNGPPPKPDDDLPGSFSRPYDPEMEELNNADQDMERETMGLVFQIRSAPPKQRVELRQELVELVNKHFEVRQQRRTLQLKRLEEELDRLRGAIQARNEAKEKIVGRRIADLLGESDDLGF